MAPQGTGDHASAQSADALASTVKGELVVPPVTGRQIPTMKGDRASEHTLGEQKRTSFEIGFRRRPLSEKCAWDQRAKESRLVLLETMGM